MLAKYFFSQENSFPLNDKEFQNVKYNWYQEKKASMWLIESNIKGQKVLGREQKHWELKRQLEGLLSMRVYLCHFGDGQPFYAIFGPFPLNKFTCQCEQRMGGRYERDICHFKILKPAVSFFLNFNISLQHRIDLKTKGKLKREANLCKGNRCPKR